MDAQPFTIRPVRVRDLPRLTRMAYDNMLGVDEGFTRFASRRWSRLLAPVLLPLYLLTAGRGYKAVVRGQIAGCAYLHLRKFSGTVFNVNVNHAYRRRGIGRALMDHVEARVQGAGLRWIALQVDRGNKPARQLYESLDYRPYHPTYLHSRPAIPLLPPRREEVTLGALSLHQGRSLFRKYADLEREEGDSWAATVVKHDFAEMPPAGGLFWRCLHGQQEIGCAWQSQQRHKTDIILLLQPAYWEQPMITLSLLRLLQAQKGTMPLALDVHFGSSSHYATAAPPLLDMGFTATDRPQILMLKYLEQEPA